MVTRLSQRRKQTKTSADAGPAHVIVSARAGSGKTTTLVEGLKIVQGKRPAIKPSPQQEAVWEQMALSRGARSVCFAAFNASIAKELASRVPAGVQAKTMHSIGFGAVRQRFNLLPRDAVNGDKTFEILERLTGKPWRELDGIVSRGVDKLVGLCKVTLRQGTPDDLDYLSSHYDIECNGKVSEIYGLVPQVLDVAANEVDAYGFIDFNDMLWLTVIHNLPLWKNDLLLVDECLPGHTPVMMADGSSKRIKDIVESDGEFVVRSFDTTTGQAQNCRVIGKQKIPNTKRSVRISVRHQSKSKGVTFSKRSFVICTEDHKIWTTNRGWVQAGKITTEDTVILETEAKLSQDGKCSKEGRALASKRQKDNCTLIGNIGGNGKGPTKAEITLFDALQKKEAVWQLGYVVPTGQRVKGGIPSRYILDIADPESMICVEVDGPSHSSEQRRDQDQRKEQFLTDLGWTVIRVTNRRAIKETDKVVCEITGNCPKPAKVVSVKPINISDEYVYDITVERCHNFYANGILVHNCQDLSPVQQEVAMRSGKRLILCGDPFQAIYGFAGADSVAMANMQKRLASTDRGCIELKLTVTRRCGRAIVAEANKIVPDLEAHVDNPEGKVLSSALNGVDKPLFPIGRDSETGEYPPGHNPATWHYRNFVQDRDMILCRTNAPLVSECFKLIKSGRKANIQGRNIGQGLISMIERFRAKDLEQLSKKLQQWFDRENAKEHAKKFPSEAKYIALADKRDCIECFIEQCDTVQAVIAKINSIFTDANTGGIMLSSMHKAKGLEAANVYLLSHIPHPHPMAKTKEAKEQESNLMYVARTRAIETLCYVYESLP